jgi:hypothetical protein
MSVTINVRFRPVDWDDKPSDVARAEAEKRWTERLSSHPGVIGFAFDKAPGGSPQERPETLTYGAGVRPVDLTTEWESLEHANTLFDNSELFADLNGLLAGAPAVKIVGKTE